MPNPELVRSAGRMVTEALRAQPGEQILMVSDYAQDEAVIDAFATAARAHGHGMTAVLFPPVRPGEEPPAAVAAGMASARAVILIPTKSITFSRAVAEARRTGTRLLVCTGLDAKIMLEVVPRVDYQGMAAIGARLAARFAGARRLRMTSEVGTDCSMDITGREPLLHDGVCSDEGEEDDIPGGQVSLAPVESSPEGRIVLDASILPGVGALADPITLEVSHGRVASITGGRDARRFDAWLREFDDPEMFVVSEAGVGINAACTLTGSVAGVDETIAGMLHVGIGTNLPFPGGRHRAKGHTDGMLWRGSLWLDDEIVVRGGVITV